MIIINLTGQLGNQMFQYALGRQMQQLGRDVYYYTGYYKHHPNHDLALPRVFDIQLPLATEKQVLAFREDLHRPIDRLRRKIFGRHEHVFSEIGTGTLAFKPEVFSIRKGLIDGYWQSEKYFESVKTIIKQTYSFRNISKRNEEFAQELREGTSVSIHVRRGDYLGGFPVMDETSYLPAICFFTERYNDVRFYVFSNDIPWCKNHLLADRISFVDWNTGLQSPYDLWLMTQCKHSIIANSSFSWWGAWLNNNPGRKVIAPKLWFNHADTPDVYCRDWIVL